MAGGYYDPLVLSFTERKVPTSTGGASRCRPHTHPPYVVGQCKDWVKAQGREGEEKEEEGLSGAPAVARLLGRRS